MDIDWKVCIFLGYHNEFRESYLTIIIIKRVFRMASLKKFSLLKRDLVNNN